MAGPCVNLNLRMAIAVTPDDTDCRFIVQALASEPGSRMRHHERAALVQRRGKFGLPNGQA